MDPLASPGTSDESSYDASTGPTTPSSSPLFGPSGIDDLALSLSQCLNAREGENGSFHSAGTVKNVCVVGAGYVGGPTAAVLALYNPSITVEVLDRDSNRIGRWQSPHLPVHEPDLDRIVRVARDGAEIRSVDAIPAAVKRGGNLVFTTDSVRSISQADIVFLAVNTPTKTFGVGAGRATNMTATDAAVQEIARHAKPGAIIVEKSTVPCGTAQRVRQILATVRPGVPFEVLSNPEFLSEGSAVENLTHPDRVLIGSSGTPAGRRAARMLANLYTSWVPVSRILEINTSSSELAKLVANAMLAQRISSINSISAICERTGADVDQISAAIGRDARIGPKFLKSGLGFGGSCFRKDISSLAYLAESLGLEEVAHYWRQVNSMNVYQRDRFSRKVIDRFNGNLVGRKLAVLGFAFKKNTGDTRESLAVDVIRSLLEERPAELAIFDPFCREEDILRELEPICGVDNALLPRMCSVKVHPDVYSACSQADAVLLLTDSDQFKSSQNKTFPKKEPEPVPTQIASPSEDAVALYEETYVSSRGITYHLTPQAPCGAECAECRAQSNRPVATEPVEWTRIAYCMKEPRMVFDGRGLLDVAEMQTQGFSVIRLDSGHT
ncbi:hypothetical protein ASPZODRAFT_119045 [Penicilliopsis zonata CBS 506.65]|uniref:UDP-glucose 6-dehydrogenase n=1 Tax=Penicilliopsis zonata CBS 506.65 TaxID=1073090 RepID=A0A1L9SFH2_9EURO|nr:hypothetical protein ASPZODRAFT_119045 [Penicilliopsis zonata CBS 506.65]OJJ45827.1 hypothetical protein ASPZODRAFT_119045 [Penicilliopsis zonata CBS 506.65]